MGWIVCLSVLLIEGHSTFTSEFREIILGPLACHDRCCQWLAGKRGLKDEAYLSGTSY